MSQTPVIFQGTFDPFTNGHLAVVKIARDLFGPVRILLLVNPEKKPLFTLQERREMIEASTSDIPGISVDSFDGLLVEYMRARDLMVCVRGVRNAADAQYELQNAHLSQSLYPALHTLFLPCPAPWAAVSSSALKAACQAGTCPNTWAPPAVQKKLTEKFLLSSLSSLEIGL